jgi:hypothetical protein
VEIDEEVLEGFREIGEYLNIRVPAPRASGAAKKGTPGEPAQQNQLVSPAKVLPTTPRAARVIPLPIAPQMSTFETSNTFQKSTHPTKPLPPRKAPSPTLATPALREEHEPEMVTIQAKFSLLFPDQAKARRPIARAQLLPPAISTFHNQVIPTTHMLLFFDSITKPEMATPIIRGQLDYTDPDCDATNISDLPKGQVFHWPKLLVSHDWPKDFQADLQPSLQGSDAERSKDKEEDEVI